ncbi:DNA-processing protein DprA [Oceanobacillus alkalisoli]|uniref:DNA-processing protein DprA n=1 Tax=Oceanobacillus alkalisoli TaxID=2925113 RepID=UPI001F11B38C|nr:DNA-processing protein DprA [Oceanobacillus alkalisoli]MCF3942445.1 DNA-processing protein DprA [Oceanobacillus alkalisoli]
MELKDIRYRLIHIHLTNIASRKMIYRFLWKDPTLASIYEMTPTELNLHFSLRIDTAVKLHSSLKDPKLKKHFIDVMKQYEVITIIDETYPSMLRTINDAPLVLYTSGDESLLEQRKILSVIGSRKPSREAIPKVKHILKPLLEDNWVITSGMAKGIDGYAHQLTLSHQQKTIAVLGGGFEYIYPREHIPLFKEIKRTGLIISEYPPSVRPAKHHFPERNRIISGLSFGILVIEAMERSGTMITVEQALDQGREVFAVPGSPLIPQAKGCHLLIQEGAKLTQHASDIQEEWLSQQQLDNCKAVR